MLVFYRVCGLLFHWRFGFLCVEILFGHSLGWFIERLEGSSVSALAGEHWQASCQWHSACLLGIVFSVGFCLEVCGIFSVVKLCE